MEEEELQFFACVKCLKHSLGDYLDDFLDGSSEYPLYVVCDICNEKGIVHFFEYSPSRILRMEKNLYIQEARLKEK